MPDTRPLGVLLDNIELELEAKGLESTKDSGPFSLPKKSTYQLGRTGAVPNNKNVSQRETRINEREEVRTMSVLFSELLVPGWADEKIGLDAVTGTYSDGSSFNLPCHTADPEMYFSEDELAVAEAKSLCGGCSVRTQCLEGALSRKEPAGVWGGELFEDGRVISRKRKAGRPTAIEVAAREVNAPITSITTALEISSSVSSQAISEESAA